MAAFVSPRAGDIPMDRRGYSIHEYQPAFIAPSRLLTVDELRKRGFGEALYSNSTKSERAARLILEDMTDMSLRIERREEWMVAQTMINNACTMQEYIDDKTQGDTLYVKFFDNASDHAYTVSGYWTTWAAMRADVIAMCRQLSRRGLPATDLVMGTDVAEAALGFVELQRLLDKNSGVITLLAFSMPLPMPKAMMAMVTAMPSSCQGTLLVAVAPNWASKALRSAMAARVPVKDMAVYLKIQPVTTE